MVHAEQDYAGVIEQALTYVDIKKLNLQEHSHVIFEDDLVGFDEVTVLIKVLSEQILSLDQKTQLDEITERATLIQALESYREYVSIFNDKIFNPQDLLYHLGLSGSDFNAANLMAISDKAEQYFLDPDYQDENQLLWKKVGGRETFFRECLEFFQPYSFGNYAWMEYAKGLQTK